MEPANLAVVLRHSEEARTLMSALGAVVAPVLLLLMLAGFAALDTGLVRAKNAAHAVATSMVSLCAAILGFWVLGFGLLDGASGYFFNPGTAGSARCALFVLGAVAAAIAAAIPGGAMAERGRLRALAALAFVAAAVVYPVYAHWVWGGGWLAGLGRRFGLGHGVVDGAGASVVHLTGGTMALVAAKVLGPRLGKYSLRGQVRPIPAHNGPMVVLGTLMLAGGWFGLLCGSTLAHDDARLAATAANALLAAAAGGAFAFAHTRVRFGKPDLSMMCNGLLAGLIGISAAGPFVSGTSALVIGAIAGLLAIEGALFIERKLRIDDPAGAAAVHGLGGAWGLLAVGIFADGRAGAGTNGVAGPLGGLVAGQGGQLLASAVGILANLLWVVPTSLVTLWLGGRLIGNRVTADDEVAGLDVPELGMTGYVNETLHGTATRSSDLGHPANHR